MAFAVFSLLANTIELENIRDTICENIDLINNIMKSTLIS